MTEPVNNEESHVEIVTKEPIPPINPAPVKIKDPRKIEAGKKLAAYNKKAKSSKKELTVAPLTTDNNGDGGGGGFNITLTTVIAVIGLGLTGVDLYLRHKKMNEKGVEDYKMTIMDYKPLAKTENNKNENPKQGVKKVRFEPGME